jgi:hypothetical protein
MTSANVNRSTGGVPAKYSISATWQAARSLPTTHFPLILPGVHPLASFFILRKLKRLGYSNCTVKASDKGLVVHAHR